MEEQERLDHLIASNRTLVESNSRLVNVNSEFFGLLDMKEGEKERLLSICKQIYQNLSVKEKRSIKEECWYMGIKQILFQ